MVISIACLCVCGRLTERSWVECFLVIFLVVEVLTLPNGGAFFCPSDILAWSLLSLLRLLVRFLLRVEFKDCEAGGWLCLFLSDFDLLDIFFSSLLLVEDCICQGVFLISHFLLILAGVLWVSLGITLGWWRYCDSFFSCPLVRACDDSASVEACLVSGEFWAWFHFSLLF